MDFTYEGNISLFFVWLGVVCMASRGSAVCVEEGKPVKLSCSQDVQLPGEVTWKINHSLLSQNCKVLNNSSRRVSFPDGCPTVGKLRYFNITINAFNSRTDFGNWTCSQDSYSHFASYTTVLSRGSFCVSTVWPIFLVIIIIIAIAAVGCACFWQRKRKRTASNYEKI